MSKKLDFFKIRERLVSYPDLVIDGGVKSRLITTVFFVGLGILIGFISIILADLLLGRNFYTRDWGYQNKILKEGVIRAPVVVHPIPVDMSPVDRDVRYLMYRGVLKILPDGSVTGDLASSWSIEDNGKLIVINLKQDQLWADGREITSEDIAFTIDRLRNQLKELSISKFLNKTDVKIVDRYTIQLKLEQPFVPFAEYLDFPIMAKHYYQPYNIDQLLYEGSFIKPLVSGKYELLTANASHTVLVLREGYKADFDTIEFVYGKSGNWRALIAGDIDTLGDVDLSGYNKLVGVDTIDIKTFLRPYNVVGLFFNLNTKNKVLKDAGFRRWFYATVNRDSISKRVHGEDAYNIYPQESPFYLDELVKSALNYKFDIKEFVKQNLVDDSMCDEYFGEPKCVIVPITTLRTDIYTQIFLDLQHQLAQYKILLVPTFVDYDQLAGQVVPLRQYDVLLLDLDTSPDPDQYVFWHSSQKEYPGLNITGISSRRLDRALVRGRVVFDKQDRYNEYLVVQTVLLEEMPFIPLVHPSYFYAFRKDKVKTVKDSVFLIFPQQRFDFIAPVK